MPHEERPAAFPGRHPAPSVEELLNSPFAARKLERELEICGIARRVLSFCRYRRAADHWCFARPSSRHEIYGGRRRQTSVLIAGLASPVRWYEEVYRRGISCASGCFVFEVAADAGDGTLVLLAGRQGRGCSLGLAYALARPAGRDWRLSWGGLPEEYRACPPARPHPAADDYYRLALRRRLSKGLDPVLGPPRASDLGEPG